MPLVQVLDHLNWLGETNYRRRQGLHWLARRHAIIGKGMIWSPNHGDTAFTVPLFDQYLKRIMTGYDWNV